MNADRNLLFGILALQMDFIDRDQLIEAMYEWVKDKSKRLGEILIQNGGMDQAVRDQLEPIVDLHVKFHGGAELSLAAVGTIESLRDELRQIGEPELDASLTQAALKNPETERSSPDPNQTLSMQAARESGLRFQRLRPYAAGGLGEVSVALDSELNREVALKEIRPDRAHDTDSRARFTVEAEITGGLEHPGIVPVYGLGSYSDGRPYYAMRFIRGQSLREAIEEFHQSETSVERGVEFRKLLGRFVDVCNAIQYAHSRGVLHRDLKPSNIMLGKFGETLVVDWGLAKAIGQSDPGSAERSLRPTSSGSTPTQMGSAVGTPSYMSPEQAIGKLDELGPATDIYSLGATLYCLLTGEPPFKGSNLGELLKKTQQGNFRKPRELHGSVPKALEAICLKAMALKPEHRYGSAEQLAEELERWLADEPVFAFNEPLVTRFARWTRNHQASVTGVIAAFLVAGSALLLITILVSRQNHALSLAYQSEREQAAIAEKRRDEAVQAKKNSEKAEDAERKQRIRAERSEERSRQSLTVSRLALVNQKLVSDPRAALDLLEDKLIFPQSRRGFVWNLFHRWARRDQKSWQGHTGIVTFASFLEQNSTLVTAGLDGTCKIWDTTRAAPKHTITLDAPIVAAAIDQARGEVILGDGNGRIHSRDARQPKDRAPKQAFDGPVFGLAISADGAYLAAISQRRLKVIDNATAKVVRDFSISNDSLFCLTFDPTSNKLYVGGTSGSPTKGALYVFSGKDYSNVIQSPIFPHGAFTALTVAKDGSEIVALSSEGHVAQINSTNFALRLSERRAMQTGIAISVSPSGKAIATASLNGLVHCQERPPSLLANSEEPLPVPFRGTRIMRYSDYSHSPFYERVRFWNHNGSELRSYLPFADEQSPVFFNRTEPSSIAHSPDGRLLVVGDGNGRIRIVDVRPPQQRTTLLAPDEVRQVEFSAAGDRLLANGKLVWNTTDWSRSTDLPTPRERDSKPASRELDFELEKIRSRGEIPEEAISSPFPSPDGKLIAFTGQGDISNQPTMIFVWNVPNQTMRTLKGHQAQIYDIEFSPDSQTIASCGYDQSVRLWDVQTGAELAVLSGHKSTVFSVAFSPDGKLLASGSYDKTIRIWSAADGEEPWPLWGEQVFAFGDKPRTTALDNWSRDFERLSTVHNQLEVQAAFASSVTSPDQAIKLLAERYSTMAAAQYGKGQLRMFTEFERNAVRYLEKLLEKQDPVDVTSAGQLATKYMNLSDILLRIGEQDEAVGAGERGVGLLSDLVDRDQTARYKSLLGGCLNNIAMALAQRGQHQEAIEYYTRAIATQKAAIEAEPTNALFRRFLLNHWNGAARSYQSLKRFDDSLDATGEMEALAASVPSAWYLVARQKAAIWIDEAARDHPDRGGLVDAILDAVDQAQRGGIPRATLAAVSEVQSVFSKVNGIAWRLVQDEDVTEADAHLAIEMVEKSLRIDPDNLDYRNTLGVALFRSKNYQRCVEVLESCDKVRRDRQKKSHPADLAFLVMANQQLGRQQRASDLLTKLQEAMKDTEFSDDPELVRFLREANSAMESAAAQ